MINLSHQRISKWNPDSPISEAKALISTSAPAPNLHSICYLDKNCVTQASIMEQGLFSSHYKFQHLDEYFFKQFLRFIVGFNSIILVKKEFLFGINKP